MSNTQPDQNFLISSINNTEYFGEDDARHMIKNIALNNVNSKLACIDTVLQSRGELINDDARQGVRLILNDVMEELETLR